MSYKNKALSILLISFIGLLPVYGSSQQLPAAPSAEALDSVKVKSTKFIVENGKFNRSPIRRGTRNHVLISIRECEVNELDPACFMSDPTLKIVSFKDSNVNFSAFAGGLFGKGCPALEQIELTNTQGVDLKLFVENLADSDLLELILKGTCKLKINRAPDDITRGASEVYTDLEVQTMIRAFREVRAASPSTVWWLVSTLTLGLVGGSESK